MGMNALWVILAVLLVPTLWMLLRKPKSKLRSTPPRKSSTVSRPNARGAASAELPAVETAAPLETDVPPLIVPEELRGFHLFEQGDMDASAQAQLADICTSMPEPHPVQSQLASGLDTPDALMEAVASDAGLTASILRTVNSAAFSLASPITSVQHAITYLGVSVVKGLVAQAAVAERLDAGSPEQQAALARVWKSACTASALAQMMGQELGVQRPSVLATKALFFNLGDVALIMGIDGAPQWYTDGVSIVQRVNAQQEACSANAAIVGSRLAGLWHLPDDIVSAIEFGLLPLVTPPAEHPMDGEARRDNVLVYLAGRFGDRVTYRGLRDVSELNLVDSDEPGLFYLPQHLEGAGLGRIPQLLQDPAFRRKANRVLATLNA